jgi:phytoene dehydrogenase-like protein
MQTKTQYDIAIVGGGHNGLIAASYLAQAGLSVVVLERQSHLGGATVSEQVFPGYDVRVSKYSYLISLLSSKIIEDLGLRFATRRRSVGSFTPYTRSGQQQALVLHNESEEVTRQSFLRLDPTGKEYEGYQTLLRLESTIAQLVWPTLLSPLQSKAAMKQQLKDEDARLAWEMFIEQPFGVGLERLIHDDAARGLFFTDAKIGVFTHPHDPSLVQNKTFLYHIMGNGTGEWRVPVGGMGAFSQALIACTHALGVTCVTNAEVTGVDPHPQSVDVEYTHDGKTSGVNARFVLLATTPPSLHSVIGRQDVATGTSEGSVFKINMLLSRLPQVKASGVDARTAFTGTFHLHEGYEYMKTSFTRAAAGEILPFLPGEMYCHSLTDDTIMAPELVARGYETLTLFGLDIPYRLFQENHEGTKQKILDIYLRTMNTYLEEPIQNCLARTPDGALCLEAKSPLDLERELGMTYGNIFHHELSWPYAQNENDVGTWGVETQHSNVFLCGAAAQRGGAVSGIPGHNAAMKVMEVLGLNSPT